MYSICYQYFYIMCRIHTCAWEGKEVVVTAKASGGCMTYSIILISAHQAQFCF